MKKITLFLFLLLAFAQSCVEAPKTSRTARPPELGDDTGNTTEVAAGELGTVCNKYPYYDNKHRLTLSVDAEPTEDNLVSFFITGTNINTTANFLISAWDVPIGEFITWEIPECPNIQGWEIKFTAITPQLSGRIRTCEYGFNKGTVTTITGKSFKLKFDRYPPFQLQSPCIYLYANTYVTMPWCTAKLEVTGVKKAQNCVFNLSQIIYQDQGQCFGGNFTPVDEALFGSSPLGPVSATFYSYPIFKQGSYPPVDLQPYIRTSYNRVPPAALDITVVMTLGNIVDTYTFTGNDFARYSIYESVGPCVFVKLAADQQSE